MKVAASIIENMHICPLNKKGNNIVHRYEHNMV